MVAHLSPLKLLEHLPLVNEMAFDMAETLGLGARVDLAAYLHRVRAACPKAATGLDLNRAWRFAFKKALLSVETVFLQCRHRREQRTGIRVLRIEEQLLVLGHLNNAPQIHDQHARAGTADQCEIVGDEDAGVFVSLLQIFEQIKKSRLFDLIK